MTNFICIENTGYGADEFTIGGGGEFVPSRDEMYANTTMPMCWAGFFKPQWLEICKKHNLKFYNLDSGYFGNVKKKTTFLCFLRLFVWIKIDISLILVTLNKAK